MDDDVADLVTDELRNFFISITTPFLDGLSEEDRYNARSWTQRVMQLKNYPLMKNYLILLSFMIFSGRMVSPFDADCRRSKLPKIPACLDENRLFGYVQGEIERRNREDVLEATESALSRDEMAFLAQLPAPKRGIRLYLATSDAPYSEWSKAHKFPAPIKYDVSAKEFTIEGLDLVRHKFEESETRQVDEGGPLTSTTAQPELTSSRINDVGEIRTRNFDEQPGEFRIPDRHNDSSAYEYDSLLNSPVTKQPRVQIIGLKKPEVFKCAIDISPDHKAIIEELGDLAVDDLPDSPPRLSRDEDFQREQKVLQKTSRWFGDPMYTRYMETIKKLLRRKIPVDAIRRSIHRCMRQRCKPGTNIPNWLRDSLDETEPWHLRIAHLKMRLSDVLKNEYGVADEDELFHLSNTPALSENDECKARELIRRAEEGRIDPAVKNKFAVGENRSCKRLMNIIDEILNSDYDPDAPPANAADSADQPPGAQPKPWKCNLETSHSLARKSYEASQASQRQSLDSTRVSNQHDCNGQNGSYQHVQNGSNGQREQGGSGQHRQHSSSANGEDVNRPLSNKCCPSGFQLDAMRSLQGLPCHRCDRDAPRSDSKDSEFSSDAEQSDFNLEDERPDELFANLPADSSTEDGSVSRSRKIDKSCKRNSN